MKISQDKLTDYFSSGNTSVKIYKKNIDPKTTLPNYLIKFEKKISNS